jgi:hypothetical protein
MDADIEAIEGRPIRLVVQEKRPAHGFIPTPMRTPIFLGNDAATAAAHDLSIRYHDELPSREDLEVATHLVSVPKQLEWERLRKASSLKRNRSLDVYLSHLPDQPVSHSK